MLAVGVVSVGAATGGASYLGTAALVATGKVTAVAVSSKVVGLCGAAAGSGATVVFFKDKDKKKSE